MERWIKRIVGKNPKEEGISGDELTRALSRRMIRQTYIWLAIFAVGALILFLMRGA